MKSYVFLAAALLLGLIVACTCEGADTYVRVVVPDCVVQVDCAQKVYTGRAVTPAQTRMDTKPTRATPAQTRMDTKPSPAQTRMDVKAPTQTNVRTKATKSASRRGLFRFIFRRR